MFKPSPRHIFLAAACGLVALAVVGGLAYSGSPATERARRLDETRSSHLEQIASAAETYAIQNGEVPESLDRLVALGDGKAGYWLPSVTDPVTMDPYGYTRTGPLTYDLCADFQASSRPAAPYEARPIITPGAPTPDFRTHDAGRVCWQVDLSSRTVSCANGISCPIGQQCHVFPGRKGQPVCVPVGRECAWAGCAEGTCQILKSNPPQVVCPEAAKAPTEAVLNPPTKADDAAGCQLMKSEKTGEVNCFGCTTDQKQDVCTEPPPGWTSFNPTGEIGIPYACYAHPTKGCQLAQ